METPGAMPVLESPMARRVAAVLLSLMVMTFLPVGCRVPVTPIPVDWDRRPEALVIEADVLGGPLTTAGAQDRVPDVRVWGDGRIVWVEYDAQGQPTLWEGRLSEEELANLFRFIIEEGFFQWEDWYGPKTGEAGQPAAYITVRMADRAKTVTVAMDLEAGPMGFGRLYERLHAGTPERHPFSGGS